MTTRTSPLKSTACTPAPDNDRPSEPRRGSGCRGSGMPVLGMPPLKESPIYRPYQPFRVGYGNAPSPKAAMLALGSKLTCGDAAQSPVSGQSECRFSQSSRDRTSLAEKDRSPPFAPNAAPAKVEISRAQRTAALSALPSYARLVTLHGERTAGSVKLRRSGTALGDSMRSSRAITGYVRRSRIALVRTRRNKRRDGLGAQIRGVRHERRLPKREYPVIDRDGVRSRVWRLWPTAGLVRPESRGMPR